MVKNSTETPQEKEIFPKKYLRTIRFFRKGSHPRDKQGLKCFQESLRARKLDFPIIDHVHLNEIEESKKR